MQSVSIKPGARQLKALIFGICTLCIVMVYAPHLCLPLTLILPLLACPLMGHKQQPVILVAAAVPAVAAFMAGAHELYAISLSLLVVLPLAVTRWLPVKKQAGLEGILWYVGAVAAALTAVAASAVLATGGALWQTLTEQILRMVQKHEQAGLILYRFAAAGLISLPEGMDKAGALAQVLEPAFIQQMLKSLKLTLESVLFELLPTYFVQVSLLVGIFCALRVQKMRGMVLIVEAGKGGEKKARLAVAPGFRMLAIPPQLRGPILVTAVLAIVCMLMNHPVMQIMGQLCYALFENVFMIAGAAVVVGVFSAKHPQRKTLFGILAAALYVFAPFLLFLIGLTDQTFHYRVKRPGHPG